ncbi:hypothetical protein GBAR_LOCUS16623 [Geodia barretti]|uniref:Uncharacterized protein n=1 Tax=Geodia barretti TaxID=519541 RepID=A0AA35SHY5_GEOBA|nr:hypothetical protein GBAR_LOCUS16623 [Geodia barretti]
MIIPEASPPTSLSSVKRASTFLTVLWAYVGGTTGHANFPGTNLTDDISRTILKESCQCDISAENIIINGETICLSELPNSIFFNATIVDYFDANSSELRAGIQSWASEGPVISILGVLMTIVWGDCISCPDLATGLCDREEFSCISTQPSTGIVQIAVTNTFSSTAPTNYIENTQTLTSSSAPRSTEMPNPPPVENTAGTQTCDCTQSLSSGILGLSVGLGIGAGLVAFLVAGGVVLIPFCIAKRRRRSYVLKQSDATLDATIIPNVAYSLSPINRDRALSTDHPEYDSIIARPRQPTQTDGEGDYEVGTPPHIRLMRIRQQEQESCLGQGSRQGDEEPQEEDKDYRRSRRYTEVPTDT